MNCCKPFFICLAATLFVACRSRSEKILEDFEKVDSSIQQSNSIVAAKDSLSLLNLSILAKQDKNHVLALKSDSMYFVATTAIDFIDSIKNTLQRIDTGGVNTEIAYQTMLAKNTGAQLYNHLLNVFNSSEKILAAKNSTERNRLAADLSQTPSAEIFIQKYFRGTPSIAAITILSKFKNDCTITAIIAMNSINNQLVTQ